MTIKEALKSTINFPLPDITLDKSLIDADLIGTSDYTKDKAKAVDLCMAGLLFTLITSPDLTEDDVSIKLPSRDVLLKVYSAICKKWKVEDPFAPAKPTVRQKLGYW